MSENNDMEWVPLQNFGSDDEAQAFTALLAENKIECDVIKDANAGGDPLGLDFQNRGADTVIVRVHVRDFEAAHRILEIFAANPENATVADAEFLSTFSDDELIDVLKKQDEWNQVDVTIALRLLKEHGKTFTGAEQEAFREERIKELSKRISAGKSSEALGIFAGVLCLGISVGSFFVMKNPRYLYALLGAFLIGALAFISGWNWTFRRKRLPDGHRIFMYENATRKVGGVVLGIAIVALLADVTAIVIRTAGLG